MCLLRPCLLLQSFIFLCLWYFFAPTPIVKNCKQTSSIACKFQQVVVQIIQRHQVEYHAIRQGSKRLWRKRQKWFYGIACNLGIKNQGFDWWGITRGLDGEDVVMVAGVLVGADEFRRFGDSDSWRSKMEGWVGTQCCGGGVGQNVSFCSAGVLVWNRSGVPSGDSAGVWSHLLENQPS
jgi:hypothetical protein